MFASKELFGLSFVSFWFRGTLQEKPNGEKVLGEKLPIYRPIKTREDLNEISSLYGHKASILNYRCMY